MSAAARKRKQNSRQFGAAQRPRINLGALSGADHEAWTKWSLNHTRRTAAQRDAETNMTPVNKSQAKLAGWWSTERAGARVDTTTCP
jgi:hypothetical protein